MRVEPSLKVAIEKLAKLAEKFGYQRPTKYRAKPKGYMRRKRARRKAAKLARKANRGVYRG